MVRQLYVKSYTYEVVLLKNKYFFVPLGANVIKIIAVINQMTPIFDKKQVISVTNCNDKNKQ